MKDYDPIQADLDQILFEQMEQQRQRELDALQRQLEESLRQFEQASESKASSQISTKPTEQKQKKSHKPQREKWVLDDEPDYDDDFLAKWAEAHPKKVARMKREDARDQRRRDLEYRSSEECAKKHGSKYFYEDLAWRRKCLKDFAKHGRPTKFAHDYLKGPPIIEDDLKKVLLFLLRLLVVGVPVVYALYLFLKACP